MSNFNVNSDELIKYTNQLTRLHRSSFPVAVRQTLNEAAFDTRSRLAKNAKKSGQEQRNRRSVYDLTSRVNKAKGFDVNKMSSIVGIYERNRLEVVARGLATQETGGRLKDKRRFIPHEASRRGKKQNKPIRPQFYSNKNNLKIQPKRVKKGDNRNLFSVAYYAFKANVNERFIQYDDKVWFVHKLRRRKNKSTWIVMRPIFRMNPDQTIKVKKRPFMAPSSAAARLKMNRVYKVALKRQIEKDKKKK